MKPSQTLQHIQRVESMYHYDGRYKTAYALVCTLPDRELMQYVEMQRFPDFLIRIIKRRGIEKPFLVRQKSTVSRMLRQLLAPGCTNKTALREGLKMRYRFVPTNYQHKILHSMLSQGTKKERLWAYTRLDWHWDDDFILPIETCFWKYHEVESASLIVRYFPLDFVYEHHERLAVFAGWGYVMRRLGKEHPELVRKELLTPDEWIRTVTHLHLQDYEADIEDHLYQSIANEVRQLLDGEGWYHHGPEEERCLTLRNLPGVSLAVWSMGQMGMADAVMRFMEYDQQYEWHLPGEMPKEMEEEMLRSWLSDIYTSIAVSKLGWSSLEAKT